jgi:uncharacterized Zn-binding protein involved in type VI secretion
MPRVARLGDTTDHGGVIITASDDVTVNGIRVARKGDLHSCPIPWHGVTEIVTGCDTIFANGKPVARIGDVTGCGATIVVASPNVDAGG